MEGNVIVTMYAIGGFLLLLVVIVLLRTVTQNRFEVKNSDIFLALIPVALGLVLSGYIQELTVGDLKIVPAVTKATKSPIKAQVSALPVEAVTANPKEGVSKIPELVKKRTQALSFQLGYHGYRGFAIKQYLKALTRYPFFEYVVVIDSGGRLFGLFDARQLFKLLRDPPRQSRKEEFPDFDQLAEWIASSKISKIESLPGFVGKPHALKKTTNKHDALQRMEKLDVQTLPVVDDEDRLVGILERSKLSASILIEISNQLEKLN